MKILTKSLIAAVPLALVVLASGAPANAYYAQTRSLYQPTYVQGFTQPDVAVPRSYGNTYGYGYQQDAVRPLIQGQLNFVSQYTYIPAPIHPYFYTYYPSYWGW